MDEWNRPPAGIAVVDFFERWLPDAYVASGRQAPPDAPLVRATLSGRDGGAWDMRADPEGLQIEAASRTRPDVWIRQSVEDFRSAIEGDANLPPLIPAGWSALDLLFLDPRDTELLRQVDGRAAVELQGRRARRWILDVAFGAAGAAAGRPRTTVRLDGATFEGLQNGTLSPVQPLFDGRLKIDGDRALAMQLLLLLGSRLGRDRR
jgi:hypothetical protein